MAGGRTGLYEHSPTNSTYRPRRWVITRVLEPALTVDDRNPA